MAAPGIGTEGPAVSGPWVAVDVGTVRIGVAVSDASGVLASPRATVRRDDRGGRDLEEIAGIVGDANATLVLIGLPTTLAGREGSAASAVRTYADTLAARVAPVPVRLVDERLTTVVATQVLRGRGVPGRRQRDVVDREAATVLLQAALDGSRASGKLPGEPL